MLQTTLKMAQIYSSVSHDSMTVSHHAQYQELNTAAAKWNPAINNFIICTCAFFSFHTVLKIC